MTCQSGCVKPKLGGVGLGSIKLVRHHYRVLNSAVRIWEYWCRVHDCFSRIGYGV